MRIFLEQKNNRTKSAFDIGVDIMIDPITTIILNKEEDIVIRPFMEYELLTESDKFFKLNAIGEHVRNRLNKAYDIGKKFGLNLKDIAKKGKTYILPKLEKLYAKGVAPQKAAMALIKDLVKFIMKYIKIAAKKIQKMKLSAKLVLSLISALVLIVLVLIINTAMLTFMTTTLGFGTWDAFRLLAVILGPFVEEAMKTIFISMGIGYTGTVLFSAFEFVMQGVIWTKSYANPSFIIARFTTTVMHLLTVYTQKQSEKESRESNDTTAKRIFNMWLSGVIIHVIWNGIALFKNEELYRTIFDPTYWKYYIAPFLGGAQF